MKGYDVSCERMAAEFLSDSELDVEAHAPLLAQEIQDVIEGYISYHEDKQRTETKEAQP